MTTSQHDGITINGVKQQLKTEEKTIHKHVDFEYDPSEIDINVNELDMFDYENITDDININDYFDPKKLNEMRKDYLKKLRKPKKQQEETMKCGDKVISKAEKKGGSRSCNLKTQIIDKDITDNIKELDLNNQELLTKLKKTIKKLESDAEILEKQIDNEDIQILSPEEVKKCREFLFTTHISCVESTGISTDKYVSEICDMKYSSSAQPKDNLIDDSAHQLVYISKLSKQLKTQLLQQSDVQLKFNNIDFAICMYLKSRNNIIRNYRIPYIVLQEFFKKLIVVNLTNVECAFRSKNCWIKPEFKKMIVKDVVMFQSLPSKLAKSWKIFVSELCNTEEPKVFNDISKLDYIIHIDEDFVIEETLARTIKCMTPCFIYNYYSVIKSVYLICGLLDDWLDEKNKEKGTKEQMYKELKNIVKTCIYIYQNTRLAESSTARNLPYSTEPMCEEAQMYYLNHTIMGPQHMLLKALEKYIYGLV